MAGKKINETKKRPRRQKIYRTPFKRDDHDRLSTFTLCCSSKERLEVIHK